MTTNNPSKRDDRRRHRRGIAAIFVLVVGALAALASNSPGAVQVNTVADALANRRTSGGWVLEDPNCGCDRLPSVRPAWNAGESWDVPTRCFAENRYRSGSSYRPINDWDVSYPDYKYPDGFPHNYDFSNFPWAGRGAAGQEIPFPGWPAVKPPRSRDGVSEWRGTLRERYKRNYEDGGNIDPPGKLASFAVTNAVGWEDWQIHHILERKHNGTDDPRNLVPAYSFPGDLNQHSKYTQWWQKIRVDSQFSRRRNIWSQIRDCPVVRWPGATVLEIVDPGR